MVAFLGCVVFATASWRAASEPSGNEPGNEPSAIYPITATWDFQNLTPASLADVNIQGNNEANVASDIDGITMKVISAGGKLQYNSSGYAQFNTNTTIQVPVKSKGDEVTVVSYPGQSNYTVGGEDATGKNTFTHTATSAEATQGYVEIIPSNTAYIYSIKVVQNEPEEGGEGGDEPAAKDVTANWDFKNLIPATMSDVNIQGNNEANVASDVDGITMKVISTGGKLQYNSSGYAQFNTNTTIQVPVKSKGDEVTVVSYPGQSNYTVGGEDATGKNTFTHTATSAEATQGYVEIIPSNTAYIYSISVTQYAPKEATTLDNEAATVTFPFNLGTEGQKATFSEDDYWLNSKVELGSNMGYASTRTLGDVTFTKIQPKTAAASAAVEDYVLFRIQPKFGFTFTPKSVSLKAYKDGTGNGTLNIKWITADGTETELASNVAIARNNENPAYSSLSYTDLNSVTPYEGFCGMKVYIGGNLANNKQVGLADIVIEGTLSGTEKEVPVLASFKINDTEYTVDDVFGTDYEAVLKLSKTEKMVSSDNPLTAKAASGEIGEITYEGTETNCNVTIPMTSGNVGLSYVLNIIQKPDYTLTYYGVDGTALESTQTIEEDSKIGKFINDIADVEATKDGYKARGWFKNNYVGEKYSVDDVVTSNLKLYAVETEIEVSSDSRKYEFDLTDKNFDAEDHEAFNPEGNGKWHDTTHGWDFKDGDKINLLVGPKATIFVTTCKYPENGTTKIVASNGVEIDAINATDGTTQTIDYEGEGGTLTLTINGGQAYIHKIRIVNTAETNYDLKGQWIYVKEGDANSFLDALDAANDMSGTERVFIYLPNGTYDLGTKTLTKISRNNISIIGESMEDVIIKNRPIKESINNTATLLNTATNTYLQDLTIDCIAPYGTGDDTKSAERGVCFQDKGNQTVMKKVYLKGLQDTYYSNSNSGTYYFEDCKIEGSVDYVCGNGDVYFNKTTFYTVNKSAAAGGSAGGCIAAPNTKKSFGYIFNECTLDGMANEDGKYRLGRPWASETIVRMLDSKMIIKPSSAGWGEWSPANAVEQFAEYNSVDADGTPIDVTQRANTIGGQSNNPVITETEAANYRPEVIFNGTFNPVAAAAQFDAPTAELKDNTITWTAVDGAAGYAIFAGEELLAIVDANTTSYTITDESSAPRRAAITYSIRVINAMGGMGEPSVVTSTDGIETIEQAQPVTNDGAIYTLQGVRVDKATKGVYIINGHKVVIK